MTRRAFALLASLALAVSCGSVEAGRTRGAPGAGSPESTTTLRSVPAGNVLRADYAGSAACVPCHRDVAERWETSPMHRMTRRAEDADITAPFDGTAMRYRGETAIMETIDGRRYVRLSTPGRAERLWRVTKVIGGRYREDYAGVHVTGTGPGAAASQQEVVLPVTFVRTTGEWRYKGYSVMLPERPHLGVGPVWSQTCIFCHNTAPQIVTMYDDLVGEGAPPYQGSTHGNLLPEERRWRTRVLDEGAVSEAVRSELALLGLGRIAEDMSLQTLLIQAMDVTYRRFGEEHLVELGIGCEACHNGSRAHAEDPRVRPSMALEGALAFEPPRGEASPAALVNRACARCHAVLFSGYGHTWEGGDRDGSPGGSNINSGEARDLLLGGCSNAMGCTTCHDPHGEDSPDALARLATPAGNGVCTSCHRELSAPDALAAHAHHDPAGAGGACVACHMPRKNLGLGYGLTRYHRIGSPTDRERVERDRPLECALCHADRTVASLIESMESWWGAEYDRDALERLYGGDLGVRPLAIAAAEGLPHEQAIAVAVLGEAGDPTDLAVVVDAFDSEVPLVRYFAREALVRLAGERPTFDLSLPGDALEAEARRWLRRSPRDGEGQTEGRAARQQR